MGIVGDFDKHSFSGMIQGSEADGENRTERGNRHAGNSFKRFCLCREMACGIKARRKGEMENTKVCFHANGKEAVKREKWTRCSKENIIMGLQEGRDFRAQ